jgi:hypothetical protein
MRMSPALVMAAPLLVTARFLMTAPVMRVAAFLIPAPGMAGLPVMALAAALALVAMA